MTSRIILSAAACAVLTLSVSIPAHGQLGGLRRAAQRAAGTVQAPRPAAHAQPAPAASAVNTGDVMEMTDPVLERFQQALTAERTDLEQLAQRLAAVPSQQAHGQCQVDFYNSEAGQAAYARLSAAADAEDTAAMTAAGQAVAAALLEACGDPDAGERLRRGAAASAEQAALAAGGFSARQYAVLKERVVPFCRASAATAGQDEVRLPGEGRNIYWVYTAAETAALRARCGALMEGMAALS